MHKKEIWILRNKLAIVREHQSININTKAKQKPPKAIRRTSYNMAYESIHHKDLLPPIQPITNWILYGTKFLGI